MAPLGRPLVDVVTTAKINLKAGVWMVLLLHDLRSV